jgi:PBP1b-binding outer membrane lipoprotein LpoB
MTNTLFNPKITMQKFLSFLIPIALFISACSDEKVTATDEYASIKSKFGTAIDPTNLAN